MLLVQGGAHDPHITCFLAAVRARSIPHVAALTDSEHVPQLRWDLTEDDLRLDGTAVSPCAAFMRYNVFTRSSRDPDAPGSAESFRAQAWFAAVQGWIGAHDHVRAFNRRYAGTSNKPEQLLRARRAGLAIPATLVANQVMSEERDDAERFVAKPVAGGGYAHTLTDALGAFPAGTATLPAPALVQNRLVPPETRVFVVGDRLFAFDIAADTLDYREASRTVVTQVAVPQSIVAPLLALTTSLGLDFAAADFKTDPDQNTPVFLEINAQPMFARFDYAAAGSLVSAMIDWLMSPTGRPDMRKALH